MFTYKRHGGFHFVSFAGISAQIVVRKDSILRHRMAPVLAAWAFGLAGLFAGLASAAAHGAI